jgi:hypothetical protein
VFPVQRRGFIILYHTVLLLWCWQTAQCKKRSLSGLHKVFLPLEWPNSVELRVRNVGTPWTKFSSTTSLFLMKQQWSVSSCKCPHTKKNRN